MSQLLLTLHPPGSSRPELSYALVNAAGVISAHGQCTAALLPKADQTVLLVPPQALSWHTLSLPKLPRGTSPAKLQTVLAGLLEEQLLDEPAQLHLSLHKIDAQDWVAACDKAWLQGELTALQQAGISPQAIAPLSFPQATAFVHASGSALAPQLSLADAHGVLHLPLAHSALLPVSLDQAQFTALPAVAAAAEQATGWRFEVTQAPQHALAAWQRAQAAGLNLAQGELAAAGRGLQRLGSLLSALVAAPAWRPLRWGLVALLGAQLVGLNAWAWQQQRELAAKRSQMNQILSTSFPQVKVIVDAPVQMQRELATLRQSQGQLSSRDFESMYSRFSAIAAMNTAPNAIDFVAGELSIKGAGLSSTQLDALAPKLQYSGLAVRSDAQQLLITDTAGVRK